MYRTGSLRQPVVATEDVWRILSFKPIKRYAERYVRSASTAVFAVDSWDEGFLDPLALYDLLTSRASPVRLIPTTREEARSLVPRLVRQRAPSITSFPNPANAPPQSLDVRATDRQSRVDKDRKHNVRPHRKQSRSRHFADDGVQYQMPLKWRRRRVRLSILDHQVISGPNLANLDATNHLHFVMAAFRF